MRGSALGKDLDDLWVMLNDGRLIFKNVKKEKVDGQLFGGFMSALNSFASQIAEGGINSFEMGSNRFYILKKNQLTFVANSDIKANAKNVFNQLETIAKRFNRRYPILELMTWDGDLDYFQDFSQDLEGYSQDPILKLKNSLW
jgi:hypothetical protein